MVRYKNLGGDSGVAGFELGIDYIIVVLKVAKNLIDGVIEKRDSNMLKKYEAVS